MSVSPVVRAARPAPWAASLAHCSCAAGLEKAGQGPDWVEKRINLYLTRFKNFAEGRPA